MTQCELLFPSICQHALSYLYLSSLTLVGHLLFLTHLWSFYHSNLPDRYMMCKKYQSRSLKSRKRDSSYIHITRPDQKSRQIFLILMVLHDTCRLCVGDEKTERLRTLDCQTRQQMEGYYCQTKSITSVDRNIKQDTVKEKEEATDRNIKTERRTERKQERKATATTVGEEEIGRGREEQKQRKNGECPNKENNGISPIRV